MVGELDAGGRDLGEPVPLLAVGDAEAGVARVAAQPLGGGFVQQEVEAAARAVGLLDGAGQQAQARRGDRRADPGGAAGSDDRALGGVQLDQAVGGGLLESGHGDDVGQLADEGADLGKGGHGCVLSRVCGAGDRT